MTTVLAVQVRVGFGGICSIWPWPILPLPLFAYSFVAYRRTKVATTRRSCVDFRPFSILGPAGPIPGSVPWRFSKFTKCYPTPKTEDRSSRPHSGRPQNIPWLCMPIRRRWASSRLSLFISQKYRKKRTHTMAFSVLPWNTTELPQSFSGWYLPPS